MNNKATTLLPSSLRPTTQQLLTHGHFQSRNTDGSLTIWSAIAENSMLHSNLMILCCTELELWPIEVLHCRNRNFQPFLLLWPWPWPWPDYIHTGRWLVFLGDILQQWKWTSYVKTFESYRITDCKCVHLVMYGHFWSCDKDGGHTIGSAIPENPMLPFCSCDADLTRWTSYKN